MLKLRRASQKHAPNGWLTCRNTPANPFAWTRPETPASDLLHFPTGSGGVPPNEAAAEEQQGAGHGGLDRAT